MATTVLAGVKSGWSPMSYCEHAPAAYLARWIECAWMLSVQCPIGQHRVPPDGCVDILYDPRDGLRAVGTMTTEQRFEYPAGANVAGIRFRPGMAGAFLGISPAELTDLSVPLEDVCGRQAREWQRQLEEARSIQEAMSILLGKLQPPPSAPNPAQQAIQAMTAANGTIDVEYAARQAGLSPRQFRRRCLDESGLTPKLLCRVLRFRHAMKLAAGTLVKGTPDGGLDWASLAAEAEYYDQSHMIRDFREFTGRSPGALAP